ncbi:Histidine kinase [Pseudogymnoascus destructans]|uniref:histidine kinase n=2 Tax=Pseudogymnoascus destructans TaxID=655981 RepID=L8G8K3_PSED2|nr:Histidine kinase [Pseudogymnoascus destructans]ELR09560.1 hypothetical protein GMDG_04055 [Pseudogymnoascus destructans 20631-21]OAF55037.1 Histidine kinase [Pseudogymnoascus destructans]
MRIPIRLQLALLVLLTAFLALAAVSISTWINNYNFVVGIKLQSLSLTASLKAGQVAANLQLVESTCRTIVTRIEIQKALLRFYYQNDNSASNWQLAEEDIQAAVASTGYSQLVQVRIFSKDRTGDSNGLLNVTAVGAADIQLPMQYPNGTHIKLGDQSPEGPTGFPESLYPNLTYSRTTTDGVVSSTVKAFRKYNLNASTAMLLGPFHVNETFSLVSMTLPIFNSTSKVDILGYMTVVSQSTRLFNVRNSREGLDSTGMVLLLGPDTGINKFPQTKTPVNEGHTPNRTDLGEQDMNFIFPPMPNQNQTDRHTMHSSSTNYGANFQLKKYPVALEVVSSNNSQINNAGSNLNTINEQGVEVAVGYARPRSNIVDWVLIVEESKAEAFAPVEKLRKILLGCIFGTIALILVVVVPTAYYSVLPITRLKEATEKSVQPPGYTPRNSMGSEISIDGEIRPGDEETANTQSSSKTSKHGKGFVIRMRRFVHGKHRKSKEEKTEEERRRVFKVPGKVLDPRHFITDELTELTRTFNEMSDELMTQYTKLEERVAERTRELEISKKAAEAANESKTLFIANISHELKTPLNGILGMCAVCMGEDDLPSIKRSLQVVYKSGDLLLHLLNDLLTFSKNQIGQSITIEEKEFVLSDIKSQVVTIFDKQVKEANIKFAVHFISAENGDLGSKTGLPWPKKALPAVGPNGTGRLKDMRLWGDQHRILQVLINLVSNSLKFTPVGGRVIVRIKCIGEKGAEGNVSRKGSLASKQGSLQRSSRQRHRVGSGSGSNASTSRLPSSPSKPLGTALLINPMDPKAALSHIHVRERSPTPPPANSKTLIFEFEVEDTGPGIPASIQDRVFEPFVQGDLGLSRKYGGTGLGLSICHQLAGLMGGTITLENTGEDQGTTFNMQIPLKFVGERTSSTASSTAGGSQTPSVTSREDSRMARLSLEMQSQSATNNNSSQAAVVEKDIQPRLVGLSQPFFASAASRDGATDDQLAILNRVAAKPGSGKIRVLVAEDNLVNQEVVLRMLKLEDIYDVTVAKDGQEAYEKVKASMEEGLQFNLIFMDIQMPNLDGLQSTRLIRQMGYSAPIVALTAFSEESNVQECMDSGMDMFLSKPIRRPALKQVLKKFGTILEEPEPSLSPQNNPTTDGPTTNGVTNGIAEKTDLP